MFKPTLSTLLACALAIPATAQSADSILLSGAVRDFMELHPDMQRPSTAPAGVYEGMALPILGADGKPQLNIGKINSHFDATTNKVTVISVAHEISNVVLKYDDGTTYKYDDQTGHTKTYGAHAVGKTIVGCWVKAGQNHSYDGSGYGTYFSPEGQLEYKYVPEEWRVENPVTFGQWFRDDPEVNITLPYTIELKETIAGSGIYEYARDQQMPGSLKYFFPIDGQGWNDTRTTANGTHNYYFTYEVKAKFTYTDPTKRELPLTFTFTGDDDIWVFIDGKLAVDLGGVHSQQTKSINLDELSDENKLQPGQEYTLDLFFAERSVSESNFRIKTTIPLVDVPVDTVSPLYD